MPGASKNESQEPSSSASPLQFSKNRFDFLRINNSLLACGQSYRHFKYESELKIEKYFLCVFCVFFSKFISTRICLFHNPLLQRVKEVQYTGKKMRHTRFYSSFSLWCNVNAVQNCVGKWWNPFVPFKKQVWTRNTMMLPRGRSPKRGNGRTYGQSDVRTHPLIEMLGRILKPCRLDEQIIAAPVLF